MIEASENSRSIRPCHTISFDSVLETIWRKSPEYVAAYKSSNGIFSRSVKDDEASEKCKNILRTLRVRNWKEIRRVDINLRNRFNVTDNGLLAFAKLLNSKYLAHMKQLTIVLLQTIKITGKGLKILNAHFFRQVNDLKKLTINSNQCFDATDLMLEALASGFHKYQGRLRDLDLNFAYCKLITNNGLGRLNDSIGKYLLELKTYKINLSWGVNKISGQGIISFTKRTKRRVTKIALDYSGRDKITDEDLAVVGTELGHVKNITELSLDFSGCWRVTDQGFMNMIADLSKAFAHLKTCFLNFNHCCGISGESIESLGSQIRENATRLQILEVNFEACSKITKEDQKQIKETLCFIPKFKFYDSFP